ncbi:TetR/AcrR family transcriptional regulator [Massilia sp. TS11]|uniref:TetR/AcrR family transcriptional regulator n=1 Tax=Massilia sp. TS11 TaxID=2908003 RepID=UPI001EDC5969|nr:TetR/AcrR family transcriptional regulator [Massilia sp. TS11]MCG2582736.1 TetR/AcrR family transcriptional regulator [Massilia sp. TS11]
MKIKSLPDLETPLTPVAKGAGRPKAAELEARYQCLMHTAARLFLDKGFGNVSLEMIAREARVAVRTIYVKYGGKMGLLREAMAANRTRFFQQMDMDTDPRPLRTVIDDFALRFFDLVTAPEAVALQRMLAAEAKANPDLIQAFYAVGPKVTQGALLRYFERADVRAQLIDDAPLAQLPVFLLNCIMGDQMSRVLMTEPPRTRDEQRVALQARMRLFYRAVLKDAAG